MMHKEAHSRIKVIASIATASASRKVSLLNVAMLDPVELGRACVAKSNGFLQVSQVNDMAPFRLQPPLTRAPSSKN